MNYHRSFRHADPISRHNRQRVLGFAAVLAVTLFLAASPVLAGEEVDARVWSYFFGGMGVCNHGYLFFHTGGGAEGLVAGGFGLGTELGYLAFTEAPGQGIGVLSPGVIYNFSRGKPTQPFVTGGYSLFFRCGTAHALFFGGGVNRWIGDRWGIRIEGRNQFWPSCNENLLQGRFAFVFR